jgi:hypothetical protein
MNLIHRLLVRKSAVTLRTFDTMFRVIVLGNLHQRTRPGTEENTDLVHRLLTRKHTVTLRTFGAVLCVKVLGTYQEVDIK